MNSSDRDSSIRPTLSAAQARRIVDDAVTQAMAMSVPVTVAVVDESGVIKEFKRMDGAPLASVQTAVSKAYAAAALGMPPDEFFTGIESDPAAVVSYMNWPGLALIAGGLPLVVDGEVAGAVGVVGATTAAEDRRIAQVAVEGRGASS